MCAVSSTTHNHWSADSNCQPLSPWHCPINPSHNARRHCLWIEFSQLFMSKMKSNAKNLLWREAWSRSMVVVRRLNGAESGMQRELTSTRFGTFHIATGCQTWRNPPRCVTRHPTAVVQDGLPAAIDRLCCHHLRIQKRFSSDSKVIPLVGTHIESMADVH